MRGYFTVSNEERNSILNQHSSFYNGFSTGNVPSTPQPLRQDNGPRDTNGITINNKGNVGHYKNHKINESKKTELSELDFSPKFGDEREDYSDMLSSRETEVAPERVKEPKVKPERMNPYKPQHEPAPKAGFEDDMDVDFPTEFGDEVEDYINLMSDEDFSYSDDAYDEDLESISGMFDDDIFAYDPEVKPAEPKVKPSTKPERMNPYKPQHEPAPKAEYEIFLNEIEMVCECGGSVSEGICEQCGGLYEEVDTDIREQFMKEKKRIQEMFNRFKKFN